MKAKEKAEELISKFRTQTECGINDALHSCEQCDDEAKRMALICVDEILLVNDIIFSEYKLPYNTYWEEVKQELEKL